LALYEKRAASPLSILLAQENTEKFVDKKRMLKLEI
jgi:hypothetical protein